MRFPEQITTSRTILRRWQVEDAESLKAALDRNKDHLVPWIPWATGKETEVVWAKEQLVRMSGEFTADLNWSWAIRSPDQSEILGGCGLHDRIGPGGLEVGYWVDRHNTKRGLATETASALVQLALADVAVELVEMHVDVRNHASARIPERLGFTVAELRPRVDRWGEEVTMMIWRLRK